ncbi:MAG: ABC transporter permease [Phycisphaerales bacterium]
MVLIEPARALWKHRVLAFRLAQREVAARWKGSFLGPFWTVVTPLFMLAVYTFVFATIFQRKWTTLPGETPPFSLVLFTGLIPFQLFAETANSSAAVVQGNTSFVKQVVFPLEILPFVNLLVAMFHAAISALVLLLGYFVLVGVPPATALWIPLIALPLPFFALGLGWLLAALGAYMKDTVHLTTMCTSVLLFLSPVFYSLDSVPASYRSIVRWNPLTTIVNDGRAAVFFREAPQLIPLAVTLLAALVVFEIGFRFFRQAKEGFADVV